MGVLDRRLVRQLRGRADERMIDVRRIRVRFIEGEDEQGLLAVHRGEELRHPAVDVVVSRRNRAGVHVVAVVRSEPNEIRAGVEGIDHLVPRAREKVRAPRWAPGDRRVGEEGEVVFASRRVETATGTRGILPEGLPRVTGILDEIDDGWMIQIRMVSVARHAERAGADVGDVIRLRRIRDARPVLRESIFVRELRHVRRGPVDLILILVLHEDDDDLVEIVRGLAMEGSAPDRIGGIPESNEPRNRGGPDT